MRHHNSKCNSCTFYRNKYSPVFHTFIMTCTASKPIKIGCVETYKKEDIYVNDDTRDSKKLQRS